MTPLDYSIARERMVRDEVIDKGISDPRVIECMRRIPRHLFLDHDAGPQAYSNHPFPIGHAQTMSQPFMVAYLAENLCLQGHETILEIGTGSGYQAAVLASLAKQVYSIERIADLAAKSTNVLAQLGIDNVTISVGDGAEGWPQRAMFDRILLTAAATGIPEQLLDQLTPDGFLLGPVVARDREQEIVRLHRHDTGYRIERLKECSFVPLIREPAEKPLTTPDLP